MATNRATMSMAKYRAMVRKLAAAYEALKAADASAEYRDGEQVARAMTELRRVPDTLRVQVCRQCSAQGYFEKPDDPYTAYGCLHPDVPRYDLRLGMRADATTE